VILNERQKKIVETLLSMDTATVDELSTMFNVSTVTIRSDLNQLAESGEVIRSRGGARIADERVRQEYTFGTRRRLKAPQKIAIGESAAQMLEPHDSILLDASSTAVAVAQAIKRLKLAFEVTVVTTGIWTALELLGDPNIQVVLMGGFVRNTTGSITGNITKENLDRFNFNKVFLGAWGLDLNHGLTDSHMMEIELKRDIIKRSQDTVIVIDSSKFGRIGLAPFAACDQIHKIITDISAPEEIISQLRNKSINIILTDPRKVN